MASYYAYLISSLPTLLFGAKPPFDQEQFLDRCAGLVPAESLALLRACAYLEIWEGDSAQATLKEWVVFERSLRNELVRLRASRKKIAPEAFLRDGAHDPALAHVALASHRAPTLVESEMMLDRERWQKLDELAIGHYFDLDILIIYVLKLQILSRWERIHSANPARLLEALGV